MLDLWSCAWFPDLRRLESPEARLAVFRTAYSPVLKSPTYLLIALAVQVGAQVLIVVPAARAARARGLSGPFIEWALPLIVALLACVAIAWLVRRAITRSLRRELTQRGLPTCLTCGYDLTHNTSRVCPECGRRTD